MASCANFFNMHACTYNINKFFAAYIIYLSVNGINKSENDHFNGNKIIK